MNKKILWLCKDILGITLAVAMLLYFGFANGFLLRAHAEDNYILNSTEQSTTGEDSSLVQQPASDESSSPAEQLQGETGNALILPENEDVTDSVNTVDNTQIVVASITYTYDKNKAADTDNSKNMENTESSRNIETTVPDMVTETLTYYNLPDAFVGAEQVRETMAGFGETDYVPVIKLVENIAQSTIAVNTDNASFILDLNGHTVVLGQEAYLDFGEGSVVITDTTQLSAEAQEQTQATAEASEQTLEVLPGRVTGSGLFLFTGKGMLRFEAGCYQNENTEQAGQIVDTAENLVFEDGYFLTGAGQIVNSMAKADSTITVTGGFYTYDVVKGFAGGETITFEGDYQLVQTTQLVGETEVIGYSVAEPEYVVHITVPVAEQDGTIADKELVIYYCGFTNVWTGAAELSRVNGSAVASIAVCNQKVTAINISQIYTLAAGEDGSAPHIRFTNMKFQRKGEYDGNFFTISGGTITFEQCSLDGFINDVSVSQGSLIWVTGQGVAYLKDTTIQNNRSIVNGQTGDPGAGVAIGEGAFLHVSGQTEVKNNALYTPASGEQEAGNAPRNVYMESGAQIVVDGAVTGSIGVNYSNGVIAGLTVLGAFQPEYLNTLGGTVDEASMKSFSIDNYPTYFLGYHSETNQLYWDKDVRYLPEAGELRLELLILLVGLFGFILHYLPVVKKRKAIDTVILIVAFTCLAGGSIVGFLRIQNERRVSENNMQVIATMTAKQKEIAESVVDTELVSTEENLMELETETKKGLVVPDDGREYYGIVEIPELGLRLPVLMEYTDANMKTSPCVYYGDAVSRNLVVVGHNYDSQFGKLNQVAEGLEVWIHLMDGTSYRYVSTSMESYNPDQVEEVLVGDWDLTLLTCNYAGDKRIVLRCAAK